MDLESDRIQNTFESVSQALQQRVTRRTCDFHVARRACTSTFDIARQTIYLVNETRRARTSRLASLEESRPASGRIAGVREGGGDEERGSSRTLERRDAGRGGEGEKEKGRGRVGGKRARLGARILTPDISRQLSSKFLLLKFATK